MKAARAIPATLALTLFMASALVSGSVGVAPYADYSKRCECARALPWACADPPRPLAGLGLRTRAPHPAVCSRAHHLQHQPPACPACAPERHPPAQPRPALAQAADEPNPASLFVQTGAGVDVTKDGDTYTIKVRSAELLLVTCLMWAHGEQGRMAAACGAGEHPYRWYGTICHLLSGATG